MSKHDSFPAKLLEDIAERLTIALQLHGYWCTCQGTKRLSVYATSYLQATIPEHFCHPPRPDKTQTVPCGTPERLKQLIKRGEQGQHILPIADQDLEALERLGAMLRQTKGKRDDRRRNKDRRKNYQVVIETHSGVKRVGGRQEQ
jgi:hypothetical protein